MPNTNSLWGKIEKFFSRSKAIDLLESELKKAPEQQSRYRITALTKTLCLYKELIPTYLLQKSPILIEVLKEIVQETPFNKKIIYHDHTEYEYKEAVKHNGEVHCMVRYRFLFLKNKEAQYMCLIDYTAVGFIAYDPYLTIQRDNQYEHYAVESTGHRSIEIESNTYSETYLDNSLRAEGFTLTNIPLIAHARQALDNYNLANDSFRQSNALREEALKACLHLPSTDHTPLKTAITQSYFSNNANTMKLIPAIVFSHLQTSSKHPEETYAILQLENQQEKETNLTSICAKATG